MNVPLEVLHVPDCPNLAALLNRLQQVSDLPITTREITTDAAAAEAGMAGSPTLLINGVDPFGTTDQPVAAVACRIYRDQNGHATPAPTLAQLRVALDIAGAAPIAMATRVVGPTTEPSEVLSAWRRRALPVEPVEKAVHQAILRSFATSGHAPAAAKLEVLTAGTGRGSTDVLTALHNLDAIRLDTEGQIAVAYPFSAHPTRHRVRIADQVDTYAMCAIDALGMGPMLDQDTRIDSTDVTTGQPVSLTTTAGRTKCDPPGAVVFTGATAGGGPSADCCCDYLNFFTDDTAAKAWAAAHPHVPGQALTKAQAEALASRLFAPLLRHR